MKSLFIKSTTLKDFKNYHEASFTFSERGNLIVGKNGIGKSNLLEAISYFTYGRSILGHNDNLLINFNTQTADSFLIKSTFCLNGIATEFKAYYQKKNKVIQIDDRPLKKLSDLYQYIQIVYSSPEDIFNIFSTPARRRQFLDMAISKVYNMFIDYLRRFRSTLLQRNALLSTDFSIREKEAWDYTFCTDAMHIIEYRTRFFEVYRDFVKKSYQMIVAQDEEVDIIYKPNYSPSSVKSDESINIMTKHLAENTAKEKKYQTSLIGPHRDDFIITINKKNATDTASQGQKRSIVIALKLALAEMIANTTHTAPILIFDDTLAELDKDRSSSLLSNLTQAHQIFIASPTPDRYENIGLTSLERYSVQI